MMLTYKENYQAAAEAVAEVLNNPQGRAQTLQDSLLFSIKAITALPRDEDNDAAMEAICDLTDLYIAIDRGFEEIMQKEA